MLQERDLTPALYTINWFTVLPVTGLNLTAVRTGTDVLLNWKTISEINSDYFEIERSTDGRNYVKIGNNVRAAGNSNIEQQYQSPDDIRNIESVTEVYYRVKLKDVSGKIAYSNVAIVKLPANGAIKVSPNPFMSQITISISVEQNTSMGIRMLDMSGRTISVSTQTVSKEMPQVTIKGLSGLVRGIYLVEVSDIQSGSKKVFKLEKAN